MASPRIRRFVLCASIATLVCLSTARDVNAQGFISPFLGYNFGGDAGCPEITDCDDKRLNWGVSFGAVGAIVGFEAEFSYTDNFFGETSNQTSNVLTFMGNFMLAPKLGPVQPYGLVGAGLIRTSVETTVGTTTSEDENQFGWDVGGGVMIFFGQNVGIRGDIRYFHSFEALELIGLSFLPDPETKLDYGRAAAAIVFKF